MIADIHNFLKLFITENGIPLKQVLTEADLVQLSVTIGQITTSKTEVEFKNIGDTIFKGLGDKGKDSILYPIQSIPFEYITSDEEARANLALMGYLCLQYFVTTHDLPIEKVLDVVNQYMNNHIVNQTETHTIDTSNPVSNLIRINETQYVRFNGKTIIPPKESIKEDFIKQLNSLLIK